MSEKCPKCGSSHIAGLMESFWVPLDEDGDHPPWEQLSSETEVGAERMCYDCGWTSEPEREPIDYEQACRELIVIWHQCPGKSVDESCKHMAAKLRQIVEGE